MMRWPWQKTWTPPVHLYRIYDKRTGSTIRHIEHEAGRLIELQASETIDVWSRTETRSGRWTR